MSNEFAEALGYQSVLHDLFSALDRCTKTYGIQFTRSECDAHLDLIEDEDEEVAMSKRTCPRCPELMDEVAMDWDDEITYVMWQWVCSWCGYEGNARTQEVKEEA